MNPLLQAMAVLLFSIGASVALAAPPVPSSVMPGHERERFTESPVERFMQPGPYQPPQVIEPAAKPQCKPGHPKSRTAKRKGC